MCDPFTLALGALSIGSSLFGAASMKKPPAPPVPETPATPAPTARAGEAVVRVGGDTADTSADTAPEYNNFTETRASGKTLGGLGRGGLGL